MLEKIAHWLTRKPKLVALAAVLLMIPSVIGFAATRVNYDILSYLPADLESVQGERLLEEPFHMAATSMLIVEGMPAGYTNDLINEIKKVPGVSSAVWLSNMVGIQIPTDMIPANFRDMFFSGDATMLSSVAPPFSSNMKRAAPPTRPWPPLPRSAPSAMSGAFWRAFPW